MRNGTSIIVTQIVYGGAVLLGVLGGLPLYCVV
jgi:hypothetical protein